MHLGELPQVWAEELCPRATSDKWQLLEHTVEKDAAGTGHCLESPGCVALGVW